MTPEENICRVLAHSIVFFSRQEWLAVADCVCNEKSTSSAEQSTTQQQIGVSSGTSAVVAGAGSRNANNSGFSIQGNVDRGSTVSVSTQTEDPELIEAALGGAEHVALASIQSNADVANNAIGAGVAYTALNEQFGNAALDFASNAQAQATTTLENEAQQFAAGVTETANNALAAAQNETLAGVTPAQQFQASGASGTLAGQVAAWSTTTWIAVIGGILAILYYLKARK
jgi:hypothetical protein